MSAQDPFCWDGSSAAARPGSAEPGQPRRRGRLIAAALVVAAGGAAAAVVLLSGAGASGGGGVTELPLASAAAVTEQLPGFQTTMAIDVTVGGRTVSVSGHGAVNLQPQENGAMTVTTDGETIPARIVGSYVYEQLPTNGNPWVRIDLGTLRSSLDVGTASFSESDPTQLLGYLRSIGSVTDAGEQALDGVTTTRYDGVLDLDRAISATGPSGPMLSHLERALGGSTLPLSVWVDAQQRVRQIVERLSLCTAEGPASETLTVGYGDFGPQPTVTAPSGEVPDITSTLASELSKGLASVGCH